jgi:hypothetical protein
MASITCLVLASSILFAPAEMPFISQSWRHTIAIAVRHVRPVSKAMSLDVRDVKI